MVQDPKNRKYITLCFSPPSHFAQDPIALELGLWLFSRVSIQSIFMCVQANMNIYFSLTN